MPRVTILQKFLIASLISLLFISTAWSQSAGATTSILTGSIADTQRGLIAGARITVKNVATNLVRETTTDTDGSISVNTLPPGDYELTVMADGFAPRKALFTLELGKTTVFNLTLQPNVQEEVIEVLATSLLDSGKTESSTNVNPELINALPINRRSFLDFSLTAPRVTPDRLPQQGVAATSGLSFNGQSARLNSITLDGLDNSEAGIGAVRSTFSQEAVQEFQIVSDSYTAEFGRATAGIVNVVTKSGSNDIHGRIFSLIRNDDTSARDVFASFKPSYKQYQFGGILSGPVQKDKTFYFLSFERLSIKQNNIVTLASASIGAARRQGFPISSGPIPFGLANTSVLGRIDTRLTPNNSLFVRYNFSGVFNGAFEPFGGLIAGSSEGTLRFKDNTLGASNTYVNNRLNLINETRFLFDTLFQRVSASDIGPQIRITAAEGSISFGRTRFLPQRRVGEIYQFVDNLTLIRGRQRLKFGIDTQYFTRGGDLPFFSGGTATFTPLSLTTVSGIPNLPILSGLQAFDPSLRTPDQRAALMMLTTVFPKIYAGFPANVPLADLPFPRAFSQGFGIPRTALVAKYFSGFIQDDIKLKRNLLLKAGLRYDNNRVTFFPSTKGNFSPRLALSYQFQGLPLVLRASYGVFFGSPLTGVTSSSRLLSSGDIKLPVIPFPFAILPYSLPGHHFPESAQIPASVNFIPQLSTIAQIDPNLRSSYSHQANLGVSFLLAKNEIAVNYNYSRGVKILGPRNINPIVRPVPGNSVLSAIVGRPNPKQGNVVEFESAFDSYYNGVTISINRPLANKITGSASYTFSKSIDNSIDIRTDIQEVEDPLRPGDERSLSLQDVRQRFVLSGNWELSYTKNPFLRDFQVATIITLESGRPYNLLAGVDLNQNGDSPAGDRPLIGGVPVGRNAGVTRGFANVDLRLTRSISINERVKIQAYAEAFNLFNRVNISDIDRTFPPDLTGRFALPAKENGRFIVPKNRFRNAFSPRQIQFGFRLNF